MASNPSQNTGTLNPTRLIVVPSASFHVPACRALKIPSHTPLAVAMASATIASSIVAGQVRARSSFTSRPVTIDSPKLPRPNTFFSQITYCVGNGRFNANRSRIAAIRSGVGFFNNSRAGSPGTRRTSRKTAMLAMNNASANEPNRRDRNACMAEILWCHAREPQALTVSEGWSKHRRAAGPFCRRMC